MSLKLVLHKPHKLFLENEYIALCPMARRNDDDGSMFWATKYISQNPVGRILNYTIKMHNGLSNVVQQKIVYINHK